MKNLKIYTLILCHLYIKLVLLAWRLSAFKAR